MFLGTLTTLLFIQIDTFACSCGGRSKDIEKEVIQDYNEASMIFSGKVVEGKWIPITEKNASGKRIKAEIWVLKFAVDSWWKGETKDEVVWRTSTVRYPELGDGKTGSNCEFGFKLGRKYLVYATNLEDKLIADVCGGTTAFENADSDIEELQKLREVIIKKNLSR